MADACAITGGEVRIVMPRSSPSFRRKLSKRCVPRGSVKRLSTLGVDAICVVVCAGREMGKT